MNRLYFLVSRFDKVGISEFFSHDECGTQKFPVKKKTLSSKKMERDIEELAV